MILGSLRRAGMSGTCTGLDIGLAIAAAKELNYDAGFVADVLSDAEGVIVSKINEKTGGEGE
jgi:hypothetical protein